MMKFDTRVFNLMQESILVWDKEGNVLVSNDKVHSLYELPTEMIHNCNDITQKWIFFDAEDKLLQINDLPFYSVIKTNIPITDVSLKIVCGDVSKWITVSAIPIFDDNGIIEAIISTSVDVSHLKMQEMKYKNIANYDPLTKLPNRLLLDDRLEFTMAHAKRNKTGVAVCMIDLDGFKEVNDTYGHDGGDIILIEAAKRMQNVVRADDTVARLGGDEFVIVLSDLNSADETPITLDRLVKAIASPYVIRDKVVNTISASIGVTYYPDDATELDILLRHADIAMYASKTSGKNKFSFFDIASDRKIKANFHILNKIKKSIEKNEFFFDYQPKLDVISGQIVEVEALARWNNSMLGILSPSEFLPLIENDEELSNLFGEWTLREAIRQLKQWQEEGIYLKICINISPREFNHKEFIEKIKNIISETQADFDLLTFLEFEVLETAVVENLNKSKRIIQECQSLGISFALDEFGMGYSSLKHLKELAIDTIKIDRSFVFGMLNDGGDLAIIQAVIGLANAFNIRVASIGAQTIEEVMTLMEMGCDEIQGFSIAHPMAKESLKQFIVEFIPDPRWKMVSQTLPSKADFELLLAETNHSFWVESVLNELEKMPLSADHYYGNVLQCSFGKWLEKNKNYMSLTHALEVITIHKELHVKVQENYQILLSEERCINEEEKEAILMLSHRMKSTLKTIRNEMEYIKSQTTLINKILEKREKYAKAH